MCLTYSVACVIPINVLFNPITHEFLLTYFLLKILYVPELQTGILHSYDVNQILIYNNVVLPPDISKIFFLQA